MQAIGASGQGYRPSFGEPDWYADVRFKRRIMIWLIKNMDAALMSAFFSLPDLWSVRKLGKHHGNNKAFLTRS